VQGGARPSRKELMKNITTLSNKLLHQLPFKFKEIRIIIKYAYERNIEYLNSQLIELDYDRNSMRRIKKIKESDRTSKLVKNNLEGIKNMGELLEDIKKGFLVDLELSGLSEEFNKVDSKISRMDKFNLENTNPLSVIIREILANTNMSVEQKQLTIEKATLEYDRN